MGVLWLSSLFKMLTNKIDPSSCILSITQPANVDVFSVVACLHPKNKLERSDDGKYGCVRRLSIT